MGGVRSILDGLWPSPADSKATPRLFNIHFGMLSRFWNVCFYIWSANQVTYYISYTLYFYIYYILSTNQVTVSCRWLLGRVDLFTVPWARIAQQALWGERCLWGAGPPRSRSALFLDIPQLLWEPSPYCNSPTIIFAYFQSPQKAVFLNILHEYNGVCNAQIKVNAFRVFFWHCFPMGKNHGHAPWLSICLSR